MLNFRTFREGFPFPSSGLYWKFFCKQRAFMYCVWLFCVWIWCIWDVQLRCEYKRNTRRRSVRLRKVYKTDYRQGIQDSHWGVKAWVLCVHKSSQSGFISSPLSLFIVFPLFCSIHTASFISCSWCCARCQSVRFWPMLGGGRVW